MTALYEKASKVIQKLAEIYGKDKTLVILGNHHVADMFFSDPDFSDKSIRGQIWSHPGGIQHYSCLVVLDADDIPHKFKRDMRAIVDVRGGGGCYVEIEVTPPDRTVRHLKVA